MGPFETDFIPALLPPSASTTKPKNTGWERIRLAGQKMNQDSLLKGGSGSVYGSVGTITSGLVSSIDGMDGKSSMAGDVASGVLSGAGLGLTVGGPIGAAIGAVGGGLISFFTRRHQEKERKAAEEKARNEQFKAQRKANEISSTSNLSNFPVQGVQTASLYAKGGMVPVQYKVEDGEILLTDDRMPPVTDRNGTVRKIAPNTFKFSGAKHSSPSGGIGVVGGNAPYEDSLGNQLPSGFILSNKLKAPSSKYLKNI